MITEEKRTSVRDDVRKVLAEPFPGTVAQGGCPGDSERFQMIMKQWVGNAHGDQAVRCLREKRLGRFDIRGGRKVSAFRQTQAVQIIVCTEDPVVIAKILNQLGAKGAAV